MPSIYEATNHANDTTRLFSKLRDPKLGRMGRAVAAVGTARMAFETVDGFKTFYQKHRGYTVAVKGDEDIYQPLHAWLLAAMKPRARRGLIATTRAGSSSYPSPETPFDSRTEPSPDEVAGRLRLLYDGGREQFIRLGGHRISVQVVSDGLTGRDVRDEALESYLGKRTERILFTAYTPAGRDAVEALLRDITVETLLTKRQPRFLIYDGWSGWDGARYPHRELRTLSLAPGLADELVADLATFLANEARYDAFGLPWHRGYLFHGEPGTGKTTTIKALATHLGLDLYYLPLSSRDLDDTKLAKMVAQIRSGSVLVLEDIDTVQAAHDRDEEPAGTTTVEVRQGITMGGLLNVLDGVVTPHGLITMMTTNHRDRIDPGILRAGRVDRDVEVGPAGRAQVAAIYEAGFGRPLGHHLDAGRTAIPARVMEAMKPYLDDPEAAALAIKELWHA